MIRSEGASDNIFQSVIQKYSQSFICTLNDLLEIRNLSLLKENINPGAVIIGGHFASLAAARNLGKHGISVYVVDSENCLTRYSKYAKRYFLCPPEKEEENFLEFLTKLPLNHSEISGSVTFFSTDEQVRIFSQNRDILEEHYIITVPEWDITKYLYDKRLSYALAKQQHIPTPETICSRDLRDILKHDLRYPLVLKPAITSHFVPITKKKAYRVDNPQELVSLFERIVKFLNPEEILLQEFISGGSKNLYSYFGYFKEGKPIIGYAAMRLRQHPIEFGRSSTFVVSSNIPELETLATQLLMGIGYTGMAEVEFMFDPEHFRFEFLEVNPRIWGWIDLSMHAGVDIPYIAYAEMVEKPYNFGRFIEGVKWMHLATDLPTAFSELFHGRLSIKEYIQSIYGSHDAVFSINDPIPFFVELCLIPSIVKRRGY